MTPFKDLNVKWIVNHWIYTHKKKKERKRAAFSTRDLFCCTLKNNKDCIVRISKQTYARYLSRTCDSNTTV